LKATFLTQKLKSKLIMRANLQMILVKILIKRFKTTTNKAFWKTAQICSAITIRNNHQTIDKRNRRYQYVSNSFRTGMERELLRKLSNSKSGNGIRSTRNTKYPSVCQYKLNHKMKNYPNNICLKPLKVLKLVLS